MQIEITEEQLLILFTALYRVYHMTSQALEDFKERLYF